MQPQTPKEAVKQIQASFWLLFIFPVLLLTVFYFYISIIITESSGTDITDTLFIVLLGLSLIIIPGMYWLSRLRIKRIHKGLPLMKKLHSYRDFLLLTYISLEFCLVFSAFYYLLTGNDYIFILASMLLIFFVSIRPTKEKILSDLELTQKERLEIG